MYLLRPTPELWTISLPHRTQILYAPDMAFILTKLNLSCGATVIEAGTGSGSFTHTLARTVARGGQCPESDAWRAPSAASAEGPPGPMEGRVYSFEFHAERAERAREEVRAHGLDGTVVLQHRNVCKDGFGLTNAADSVFLDLPAPWEAIPAAREALRSDATTTICCFSPCIEQVLRTVTALTDYGFGDVTMYESLIRTHESITNVAPMEPISDVIDRIRTNERNREARREMQIANSRKERENREAARVQAAEELAEAVAPGAMETECLPAPTAKRKEVDESGLPDEKRAAHAPPPSTAEPSAEMLYSAGFHQRVQIRPLNPANVYSRPFPQMRGHTSYLTFATLLPRT